MTKTGKALFSLVAGAGVIAAGWLVFALLERLG